LTIRVISIELKQIGQIFEGDSKMRSLTIIGKWLVLAIAVMCLGACIGPGGYYYSPLATPEGQIIGRTAGGAALGAAIGGLSGNAGPGAAVGAAAGFLSGIFGIPGYSGYGYPAYGFGYPMYNYGYPCYQRPYKRPRL
jgi:hypothetical protein